MSVNYLPYESAIILLIYLKSAVDYVSRVVSIVS